MSVAEQKQCNPYLQDNVSEQEFRNMRSQRDSQLKEPKMIHPSLQINIRGGRMPTQSSSGERMLMIPLRQESTQW